MILKIIFLIILFFLAAFFSACETTLTSIHRLRLKDLISRWGKGTGRLKWTSEYSHLLTTILIGVTIVELIASALGAAIIMEVYRNASLALATGIMIFFILFFGEIIPKIYSKRHAEQLAPAIIPPLRLFDMMLSPIIKTLTFLANIFIFVFGMKSVENIPSVTERELKEFVDMGQREGVVEKDEGRMIHSVFEFVDKEAVHVMMPKEKIFAIKEDMDSKEIIDRAIESGYSRLPIYRESIDHIIGILYTKDLLIVGKNKSLVKLQDVVREPYFVIESMKIKDLLKQFQKRHLQIGIVVDDNNITRGLVTMEDLVEEIVGDIQDEYDTE